MSSPDRSSWPVRVFSLGDAPGPDLSSDTTPEERLAMVWELTLEAWSLLGSPIPEWNRSEGPVRVVALRNKRATGRSRDLADLEDLGETP
jgi:hypothetical protein